MIATSAAAGNRGQVRPARRAGAGCRTRSCRSTRRRTSSQVTASHPAWQAAGPVSPPGRPGRRAGRGGDGAHRRSAPAAGSGRPPAPRPGPCPFAPLCGRPGAAALHDGGDQGEDRPEEQEDGRGRDADRLRDQGGRLPDAVVPAGHLLPGGHGLAGAEPAEHAQPGGELGVGPQEAGLDEVKLVLVMGAEAHDVLLSCGLLRVSAHGARALRGPGAGPGPQGPHPRGGQRAVRRRAAKPRPAAARAISTPPEKLLDQYIAWAMGCLWSRMGGAMISQMPSSRLPSCRPENPRGLARAKAPTAAAASPEIRSTEVALLPPYCSVMNHGDRATQSPVSSPSTPAAWAPMPRRLAGTAYPAAPGPAGKASGDAPPGSGRRESGVAMTLFLSFAVTAVVSALWVPVAGRRRGRRGGPGSRRR